MVRFGATCTGVMRSVQIWSTGGSSGRASSNCGWARFSRMLLRDVGGRWNSGGRLYTGVVSASETRQPLQILSTTLLGDEADSHARFLEVIAKDIRIANICLSNGNPGK